MAITLLDPVGNVAASLSTTLPIGASAQPGDVRIVRIAMSTSRTFGAATPAGWAVSAETLVASSRRIRHYVRILQAGDTDATLTFGDTVNNTNHERTAITARGVSTSLTAQQIADLLNAGTPTTGPSATALVAPSVSAAGLGMLLTWHSVTLTNNGQTATITKPPGSTNAVVVTARTPDVGGYLGILVSEPKTDTGTAATGTRTATASQAGVWNATALFLPEAATAPPAQTVTAQGIASAGAVGTPTVTAAAPGVTLYRNVLDDFGAAAISPSRWSPWDPTYVTQSGGQAHIVGVQDDWVSLHTIAERDVNEAPLGARVSTTTTAGFDHYVAHMYAADGPAGEGNEFYWLVRGGRLYLEQVVASAWTRPLDLAYDPAVHRYLALGVRAGQLEALWSTDGATWTVAYSVANPYSTTLFRWQHMIGSTGVAGGAAQLDVDEWFYLSTSPASSEAAVRNGWGAPLASSDEFAGSAVDAARWGQYDGVGHDGNGVRSPAANTVQGGYLRITGDAGGTTGGLDHKLDMMFGRWEVRARMGNSRAPVAGETPYHPVLLTWAQEPPYDWPTGAEYDFLETDNGAAAAGAFLHFPGHTPRVQEQAPAYPLDLTAWHNYAFEWDSTGVRGWIDGEPWYEFTADGIQNAPRPMHVCLQLDNYTGTTGLVPGYLDVEYARAYAIDAVAAPTVSAGADRPGVAGTQLILDGVEDMNGEIVTGREWRVLSGPDQVGTLLSTQRRAWFTPTAAGAYTLELASTNAAGTGRDTVVVTATADAAQVSPAGIPTGEAHGTATVTAAAPVTLAAAGIASAEAFGLPGVARGAVQVSPAGIPTGEAAGAPTVARGAVAVSPAGIASVEALGTPTLARGAVQVSPAGIASGELVGTAVVGRGTVGLAPTSVSSLEAVGTPTVTRGAVTVAPASVSSLEAHGTPSIGQAVAPAGIASGEVLGTAVVGRGAVAVSPAGIASAEAHGDALFGQGGVALRPSGIPGGEAFGTATLARGSVPITLAGGILSAEAVGTPTIGRTVAPAGIASGEALGGPQIARGAVAVTPAGVPSGETFGTLTVVRGAVALAPVGIASGEVLGTAVVGRGAVAFSPTGIPSGELVAAPALTAVASIVPAGIASREAHGAATLARGEVLVRPAGIASSETIGAASVVRGAVAVGPASISSLEALGEPAVGRGPVTLEPSGVESGEAFGELEVNPGPVALEPAGIPTGEEHGAPELLRGEVYARPGGIVSLEVIPSPTLTTGAVGVEVPSIGSAEWFGALQVYAGNYGLYPGGIPSAEAHGSGRVGTFLDTVGIPSGEAAGRPVVRRIPVEAPSALTAGHAPRGGLTATHRTALEARHA